MASSSFVVVVVVYYDGASDSKHDTKPSFVSTKPKTIQLNNDMTLNALKQVIQNSINILYGKLVLDIHYLNALYHMLAIVLSIECAN